MVLICPKCGRAYRARRVSANDNEPRRGAVYCASDWELRRIAHFRRLAIATANLKPLHGLSRRRIPDWLADTILDFQNPVLWPDGRLFARPDALIDDAFGPDGSFRWLSDFVRFAEREPKQRPQKNMLPRLRLLDLGFKIAWPVIACRCAR